MDSKYDNENQEHRSNLPESGVSDRDGGETNFATALGIVVSMLQHRLNNSFDIVMPNLTRLRSLVDSSVNDTAARDKITEIIGVIERSNRTAHDLSQKVFRLFGQPVQEPTPFDLNSLLYEVWTGIANQTPKTIHVSFDLPENIPLIFSDSQLIGEVLLTLLENSIKAIDNESGQIGIRSRCKESSDYVEVEIQDNGKGISDHILQELFQHPIRSAEPNRGLGLWLAGLILTRLGGDIAVKQTGVGHGTTMLIRLPVFRKKNTLNGNNA